MISMFDSGISCLCLSAACSLEHFVLCSWERHFPCVASLHTGLGKL